MTGVISRRCRLTQNQSWNLRGRRISTGTFVTVLSPSRSSCQLVGRMCSATITMPMAITIITFRCMMLLPLQIHLERYVYMVKRWRSYHVSFQSCMMTAPPTVQDLQFIQMLATVSHQILLQSSNPHYSRLYQENMVFKARGDNERWICWLSQILLIMSFSN